MAMRDLVTGSGNCDPSSSSNPLGSLVNTLVGSSSKTQERLKEIPTATSSGSNQFYTHPDNALALPGSETDFQLNQHPSGQQIMSMKKERPPLPELMTLNKGLKLAEQWVKKMSGELEEAEEIKEMEGRPSRLGLGAKVPRKPHVGPLNDPVERRLHKKLGVGRKKFDRDEDSTPPSKNEIHSGYEDEDEHLDSRTNAFNKKRAVPLSTTPQPKKK